ncbi:VOC family protein [Asticcacaulis solisilvae]|uniref:VOC family protein n=1 Tax=Asticcacaulis solisilvae TaxID=1217274 RepID=UPI003FD6CD3E
MPELNRILLYVRDMAATAAFYETHFGYRATQEPGDRLVELIPPGNGVLIALHQAAKSQKGGQTAVKLVFDVEDVAGFCRDCAARGLDFGPIHEVPGYQFANARDPNGNTVSVSSRAFRKA